MNLDGSLGLKYKDDANSYCRIKENGKAVPFSRAISGLRRSKQNRCKALGQKKTSRIMGYCRRCQKFMV